MSTATVQLEAESKRKLDAAVKRLLATGQMTAFDICKSMAYQTARNAIKTTKMVKRLAEKKANKTGFDARFNKRANKTKSKQKYAFGQAIRGNEKYGYAPYPVSFLKKYGLAGKKRGTWVKAEWTGTRMKMINRGLAKSGWVGVLRKLKSVYGGGKHMQPAQLESGAEADGKGLNQNDANVRKRMTGGADAMIANSTRPILFLNKRDKLAMKAINMTRSFLTRVMIPEAQKQIQRAWK